MKDIFSNGMEYYAFLEFKCNECKYYIDWMEATKENPICPIEEMMAAAQWDENKFPDEITYETGKGW